MYLINFGRDYSTTADSFIKALAFAIEAFKNDWEVDIIYIPTSRILVSLRDNKTPYFSDDVKKVFEIERKCYND